MANRDVDDLEADLSKKQRLINAWIAVGPEGKTTDVSELTDSSRGYASDLRRALEGEGDEEVALDEIQDAYHPELVAKYRSELGSEAISGEWEFVDQLEQPPQPPTEPTAQEETPPQQEPQPGHQQQPSPAKRHPQGQQPPPQPTPAAPTAQPGQAPPGGPTAPSPSPGGRSGQPPTQPAPQPGQHPGAGGQPVGRQQPNYQQVLSQLQTLDNSLSVHQQQAQSEINAVPPQSNAQSLAVSKYNLIVEFRQSIRQLMNTLSPGQ